MHDTHALSLDSGSTAWMLSSSALVLLMVPGLALFYGGMVRQKNVTSTIMYSFVAMAVIGVQWILVGYAIAFGQSVGGIFGWDWSLFGLADVTPSTIFGDKAIPELVFVMFQGKFAIITPALISGAVAERMKFSSYIAFILLWSTFVYCPLAHWVWAEGGWLYNFGVLDFAGGTVVHISAGVSALVLCLMVGPRRDFRPGKMSLLPHNLPLTLLGAGLLWFGWFGFNAGSAVAVESPVAGSIAGLAFTNTQTAAAAAALAWLVLEWRFHGKPTSLGVATGIVAGLVAITPAAGHVAPVWALAIGAASSAACYYAIKLKNRLHYDDSLDAFGVHGVGGIVGAILTGVFCFTPSVGLIYGDAAQLVKQVIGVAAAIAFSALATYALATAIRSVMGLRATDEQERDGLDITVHGERAYHETIG